MKAIRRLAVLTALCLCLTAGGCGVIPGIGGSKTQTTEKADAASDRIVTNLDKLDMTKWQYHADDGIYYQIGLAYCESPADAQRETLAVFVPAAYMTAVENTDGTFTCELSLGTVNGFTAETAPIVLPINTPGYSAMDAITEYTDSAKTYTDAGFVYVHAGCRGRDEGAPAGVTDLKAAVRYLRYCDDVLAGSAERIFTFGMSGGGAQSALMGATGDSALYTPYLNAIGAVQGVSDAVCGSMDWCPITNLDTADAAYEWMMGVTRSGLDDEEQAISDALAASFAQYINAVGIRDENGKPLALEASEEGIDQAGSYYDYIKGVIEASLEHFLADTTFPYDASASASDGRGDFDGAKPGGEKPGGSLPDGDVPDGALPDDSLPETAVFDDEPMSEKAAVPEETTALLPDETLYDNAEETTDEQAQSTRIEDADHIFRTGTTGGLQLTGTYASAQDYIDALNANGDWVVYDAAAQRVTIRSVADFVRACKPSSKGIGAFDQLDAGQGENTLFGCGDGSGMHFDSRLASILTSLGSSDAQRFGEDLEKTDSVGNTVTQRVQMYTPLYYLLPTQDGYESSVVAPYWRIRTGIAQSDTALTTEVNLALALENDDRVQSVDFETVWAQQHVQAERTGNSTENFIEWVAQCLQ